MSLNNSQNKLYVILIFLQLILGGLPVNEFVFTRVAADEPNGRFGHSTVYDSINHKIVLFGGTNGETGNYGYIMSEGTWIFNSKSSTWNQKKPISSPPARFNHRMVFNPDEEKTFLFGDGDSNDIWAYDYPDNTWEEIFTNRRPPIRTDYSITYDTTNQKLVLFGGLGNLGDGVETLADTWIYDYNTNTWEEMHTDIHPDGRYGHTMFYDPISEKSVIFGGHILTSEDHWYSNEVWTYDYPTNTWSELDPRNPPEPRYWHSMVYDQNTQRALLFGGYNDVDWFLDSTWIYDYGENEWFQVTTDTIPPARSMSSMVYDSKERKWLLFWGLGENGEMALNDAWEFDMSSMQWVEINFARNTKSLRSIIILSSLFIVFLSIIGMKIYRNKREKSSGLN